MSDIELYEIASESDRELHTKDASSITDPAKRRETKIKQYQFGKEIRTRIEVRKLNLRNFDVPSLTFTGHRATTPRPSTTLRYLPDRL